MNVDFRKCFELIKGWIKRDDNKYYFIAFFFFFMQFFVFLGNYNSDRYDVFFWFCNHTPLFFGLGFLLKRINLIKGLINIGFLGQFIWTIDFLGKIFFDFYIFNITRYVFEDINGLWVLLPIGIHIFSTNIALYFTYKHKPTLSVLLYSLIYVFFLYIGTLTYTLVERNVNWVYMIGGGINYTSALYVSFWPVIVFFIVVIPTYGIQYLLYLVFRNNKLKS